MLEKYLKSRAKQSFIAIKNPYGSVIRVFPQILDQLSQDKRAYYVGIKDTETLNQQSIKVLTQSGEFLLHTIDKASPRGRAIDPFLQHPITTLPMTGSSSGTAVNVFLGINDLGVGTDGGGSVLAPALSLNLYSIMSPLLPLLAFKETKASTDGIEFTPSLGLMSKDLDIIKLALKQLDLYSDKVNISELRILNANNSIQDNSIEKTKVTIENTTIDISAPRSELITWLNKQLDEFDIIVSKEGPIDVHGLGDTLIGHFDDETKQYQQAANKGLIRVVNMVGATVLTIPSSELATGYVLICKSEKEIIGGLFALAKLFNNYHDSLIERYFGDLGMWF